MQSEDLNHAMVCADSPAGGTEGESPSRRFFLRRAKVEVFKTKIPGYAPTLCGSIPGSPEGWQGRCSEGSGPFDPAEAATRPGAGSCELAGVVQELPLEEDQHGEGDSVMGSRGPLRDSAEALNARGSWRASGRAKEVRIKSGRPPRPAWLSKQGKKIWKQTILILEEMGVLGTADKNALARYCHTWDRWLQASRDVELNGDTFVTDKGYEGRRPTSILMDRLSEQIERLEKEFGLTPASRPRLVATVEPKDNGIPDKLASLRD